MEFLGIKKLLQKKSFKKKLFCAYFLIPFMFSTQIFSAESLSYSGRLVNANGSPVAGPVDLKVELSYTSAPTTILCTQDLTNVALSNGVFHLKLDLACGASSLTDVLINVPAGEATAIRVTDVTHTKTYSFQAIHSMPFANISETAKQLVQMGAADGQFLKWNNTTKKWEPGAVSGASGGTVTNVSGSAPLSISSGTSTPTISISQATTTTDGYLSAADWTTFNNKQGSITAGTTSQYYRGDKSWQTLDTSAVTENIANLYFTNARVLGVPLTGFSVGAGAIANTDTVIGAFGKVQGQLDSLNTASANYLIKNSTDNITGVVNVGTIGLLQLAYTPVGMNDATNKSYVDSVGGAKVSKTGDTMSGVLTLDNDLKIKGGSNYVTIKAHATSAAYNFILPQTAGTSGYVLQTDGAGNLSWINPSSVTAGTGTVNSASIVDGSIVDADINASADIAQSKIHNLTTDLAGKEASVTAGTNAQYYRGDKTWQTLNSSVVPENTNLYFTNARVLGVPLTGFSATNSAIVATDSVLSGFSKAQGQIDNLVTTKASLGGDTFTGDVYFNTQIKLKNGGAANYVTVKTNAAGTTAYTLSLPTTAGTANQVLQTDGAGVTSWTTIPTTAAPSGTAGGDLSGTYPNPTISGLAATKIGTGVVDNTEFNYLDGVTSSIQTQLNAKEGTVTAGTASQYYRGDKTWQTLDTLAVPENTRLYFTEPRVLGTVLTGFSATNTAIIATDTVLDVAGKAQGQINNLNTIKANVAGDTFTGDVLFNTQLKLKNGGAANYVTVKTNAAGTTAYTLSLPTTAGSANQVLTTDGAGVTSWTTPATTATPSGSAGGDLSGTYPNPTISGLAATKIGTGAVDNTEFSYLDGVTSSIQTQLNGKEPAITAAATTKYFRGDKTFVTLDTSVVPENGNLYFTNARAQGAVVVDAINDGVTTTAPSQNAVFDALALKLNTTGGTLTVGTINGVPTPTNSDDIVNKGYVDSFGQWSVSGGNVYRASGNVGVGTTNPGANLHVVGAAAFENSTATSSGPTFSFWKTRNYAADLINDELGFISFYGHDGTGIYRSAYIAGHVDAAPASGTHTVQGRLEFYTTAAGASDSAERMRIDSTGNVGIGTSAPKSKLDVNGSVRVGSDATACSATIAGAMRFNTPNVEYCNGTSWLAFNNTSTGAVTSAQIADGTIVDADINASANITATKLGTGVVDNTEFNYLDGVTSSIQTQLNGKQPLDATLTSLAAYNTNGILVQTAADTFVGRSIAATANRTVVTNGDGVAGNPTINIDTTFLPSPVAGDAGKFLKASGANASAWTALASSDVTTALGFTPINKAGDTIASGTFTYNGTAVLRTLDPIGVTDVATKQYVDSYGQWTKSGSDIYRASGNVGIGTTAPTIPLEVVANDASYNLRLQNSSDTTGSMATAILLQRSLGNKTTPTAVTTNTVLGGIYIGGYTGSAFGANSSAIRALATENFTATAQGSALYFETTPNTTAARATRMTINNDGNVGIGTTSPSYYQHGGTNLVTENHNSGTAANSQAHFIVSSDSNSASSSIGSFSGALSSSTSANKGVGYISFVTGASNTAANPSADIAFAARAAGDANWSEKMRIAGSGFVGIGTNSPVAVLHSKYAALVGGSPSTSGTTDAAILQRIEANTGVLDIGMQNSGTVWLQPRDRTNLANNFNLLLNPNGAAVGIGTTSIAVNARFQVETPEGQWGTVLTRSGTLIGGLHSNSGIFTVQPAAGGTAMYLPTTGGVGLGVTSPSYTLHVNGSVAGTSAYNNLSDERFKKDIVKIPNALEKLISLDGVFYNFRTNEFPDRKFSNRREMGVIAQTVEKVFPEAVSKDNKGFRSVAYSMLIAPIIESIKELRGQLIGHDKEIASQKRAIASVQEKSLEQEKQIKKLKEENDQLKKDIAEIKKSLKKK